MHPSLAAVFAASAASLALLSTPLVQAQQMPLPPPDLQRMKAVFQLAETQVQGIAPRPALLSGGPATAVPEHKAPPGGHDHTMAWRGADGCIAFFYPPPEAQDVRMQWEGPACKGGLVQGKGRLLIQRNANKQLVLGVLQGDFVNGMLEGLGEKTHYVHEADGRPTQEAWHFEGPFMHSVLQGKGIRTHRNAADKLPGVSVVAGDFHEGLPHGEVNTVRLRPYTGVAAEYLELGLDAQGKAVLEQAIGNGGTVRKGWWMVEGDTAPWRVEVALWDSYPTAARLTRIPAAGIRSFVSCEQWRMENGVLQCPKGEAWHERAFAAIGVRGAAFSLPLAPSAQNVPFRVPPDVRVFASVGGPESRTDSPTLVCNDAMARCEGRVKAVVHGVSGLYLEGPAQWQQGAVQWKGVGFYSTPNHIAAYRLYGKSIEDLVAEGRRNTDTLGRDMAWAQCQSAFDPAMRCGQGVVTLEDGGSFNGAWRLQGVVQRLQDGVPYWVATGDYGPVPDGAGRLEFKNGPWVEVRYADGQVASVGACGGHATATLRCTLTGDGIRVTGGGVDDTWPAPEAFLQEPELTLEAPEPYAAERRNPVLPGDLSRLGEFLPRR